MLVSGRGETRKSDWVLRVSVKSRKKARNGNVRMYTDLDRGGELQGRAAFADSTTWCVKGRDGLRSKAPVKKADPLPARFLADSSSC